MSILSVDNISPIGSGTSVTVNSVATFVANNVSVAGISTFGGTITISHATPQFKSIDTDGSNDYSTFQNSSGQSVYNAVDNNTHGKHLFQTAGTERMRIDSSGRVLIGTTIEGYSTGDDLTIASNGHTGMTIRSGTSAGGNIFFADGTSGNDRLRGVVSYDHTNNFMRFYTNATERLRIDSSGRLLLGTTTEGFAEADDLTINSADHGGITIRTPTNKEGNIAFSDTTSGTGEYSGLIRYRHNNDDLGLWTNSLLRLLITSDGKIGINESSPSNQLHIAGTTGTSAGGLLRLDATDGDNFILFDNTNNNTEWAVGYDSTTRSKFDIWYNDGSSYDLKFRVDGATGAVRKPENPVFIAYRVSNYNLTTTETELAYDSEKLDIGGNYNPSNGRFTAPVDGLYEFGYASIAKNTNTVYRYTLKVNGNDPFSPLRMELRLHQASSEYATNGEYVVYVNMTAGQHASVYAKSDTNISAVYGSSNYGYTYFRGRLIG